MRGISLRRGVGLAMLTILVTLLSGAPASAATHRPAPQGRPLQLVLPLVANQRGLDAFTRAVTTPGSPSYGRYRSIAWLARHFGATPTTRGRVIAFLRRAGATHLRIDATGLFADATMTVAHAQRTFGAPLAQARTASGRLYTTPAASVHLPRGLRGAATGVVGLDTRPVAHAPGFHIDAQSPSGYFPASGTPSGCPPALAAGGFTPSQYLTAYGYNGLFGQSVFGQGQRVALIEIDGFKPSDISAFASCFHLRLPKLNGFGVGLSHPLPPGGESTLDIEVLDAAAQGLNGIDVYETGSGAADVLKALTAPLQSPGFKPQVISASLGLCEQDTRASVGLAAIRASERSLEMAAASGITFLAASGDDGSSDCVDGTVSTAPPVPELAVNYPASSPWVTGVGGTNLTLAADNSIQSQTVWNDAAKVPGAGGGGGLSDLFARPSYQRGSVGANHRAVPDVALLADIAPGFDVYCSAGECIDPSNPNPWQTVGGTSAATPLLAGGLALIDQQLRHDRLQSLGLVNPLLYAIGRTPARAATVFDDVTTGNNDVGPFIPNFGRSLGCCSAAPGFDEASGWGGVNLSGLSTVALASQPKIISVGLSLPGRQHPVARRHLLATVSCTGPCLLRAVAEVTIGHGRPFTVMSKAHHLGRAGRLTVEIPFSRSQLSKLRAALARHSRISARAIGETLGYGHFVQLRTSARRLTIAS